MSVPWSVAQKVAERMAGTYPLAQSYHVEALKEETPDLVRRAEALVAEETGLVSVGMPEVAVVDRAAWVSRNLVFFSAILPDTGSDDVSVMDSVTAVEIGALLGFMSRKVLGQYELVLPTDANSGDAVYFLAPNLLALERTHQLRPSEFRFWLALHECTHRLQFIGIPWLREYFFGLVSEIVVHQAEPGRAKRVAAELKVAADNNERLVGESGIVGMLASPEQKEILDKVQALMAMLEGHGHVVMDRIGERMLVSNNRMSNLLKARRKDPRTTALYRFTGLEMKMRQYEMGEKFILDVEKKAGWDALAMAWESPENLPTLDELEDVRTWLARVS
jgi:coenzyme F420 biosynthesis associated uncharacterized protein